MLLIDGDIVTYRVGFASNDEPLPINLARVDSLIRAICQGCGEETYRVFLTSTDKSNFRIKLFPRYKANRDDAPKPVWYEEIRAYLCQAHGAEVIYGMEADDAMGIAQKEDTIICSIDKDLLQIPGRHYNFVKENHVRIDDLGGWRNFFVQVLSGDRTDNVDGIRGVGDKTARRLLEGYGSKEELYLFCLGYYQERGRTREEFDLNCSLLYVLRKENEYFNHAWFTGSPTSPDEREEVQVRGSSSEGTKGTQDRSEV